MSAMKTARPSSHFTRTLANTTILCLKSNVHVAQLSLPALKFKITKKFTPHQKFSPAKNVPKFTRINNRSKIMSKNATVTLKSPSAAQSAINRSRAKEN
jgi:hypothetical protein